MFGANLIADAQQVGDRCRRISRVQHGLIDLVRNAGDGLQLAQGIICQLRPRGEADAALLEVAR